MMAISQDIDLSVGWLLMSSGINVIYDKMTQRVIIYEENGKWIIPGHMNLAHYEAGSEPVFVESKDGDIYLKLNAVIVTDL